MRRNDRNRQRRPFIGAAAQKVRNFVLRGVNFVAQRKTKSTAARKSEPARWWERTNAKRPGGRPPIDFPVIHERPPFVVEMFIAGLVAYLMGVASIVTCEYLHRPHSFGWIVLKNILNLLT